MKVSTIVFKFLLPTIKCLLLVFVALLHGRMILFTTVVVVVVVIVVISQHPLVSEVNKPRHI
jgi:hypothetical protein